MECVTEREMRNFFLYDTVHATYANYRRKGTQGAFVLYLACLEMWRTLAH